MNDKNYSTLMVELDCLMDTRIATIDNFEDSLTRPLLTNVSKYFNRIYDEFLPITHEMFLEKYTTRDTSILKKAPPTPIIILIKDFVEKTVANSKYSPHQFHPKIILNIYPYNLTEIEVNNIILGLVAGTKKLADIEVVSMSPAAITPHYVKSNLAITIMYRYTDWLELHSANELFKKTTCPEVTLIGPMLYFKSPPSANVFAEYKKNKVDPFTAMETYTAPLISLKLIPVDRFSAIIK